MANYTESGALGMGESLAIVKRGNQCESLHKGSAAVMDSRGTLLYHISDPEHVYFSRSTIKPIQAIPLLASGAAERFGFTDKEIAICCGSHDGQDMHTATIKEILKKLDLDSEALQCGIHPPYNKETANRLIREGKEPSPLHNNCSGKHTGMLAVCLHKGWDLGTYYHPDHPLQKWIASILAELSGMDPEDLIAGTDGCGLPTYAMPLSRLALAYARLSDPSSVETDEYRAVIPRIISAMTRYPSMIGGAKEFDTDMISLAQGRMICKVGAEGAYCIGLLDQGIGIAFDIDDGGTRAAYPAAVEILTQLGVLTEEERDKLEGYHKPQMTNHREEPIGAIEPVLKLQPAGEKRIRAAE
ncbi:asparaginase [Paenibacillus aurantius]|uniref:Asparaginase n=1 Tax=Paenibacillus aurantius TaxID=2918900 RepID=A0AA96LI52_9BACL|nr:asparaginase [Paenibacillus aurantius]WNQ13428.1 asparaginase [Paenibacillus aurantius]